MFRGYYCGLCKAIGKRYGQKCRLTLTYDCTFLGLFLNAIFTDELQVENGLCLLHPLKKRKIVRKNIFLDYAADCNIILSYNKLYDNKIDEGKILDNIGLYMMARSYKKAKRKFPKLSEFIECKLSEQRALEKEKCDNIDKISEPFAQITQKLFFNEELFKDGEFDNNTRKALEWLGYNIGKWIYVADSCDDLRKDIKDGAYNPIIYAKPKIDNENIDDYKKRIYEDMLFILDFCLSEAGKAVDLLELKHGSGIIENIIYSGMRRLSMEVMK